MYTPNIIALFVAVMAITVTATPDRPNPTRNTMVPRNIGGPFPDIVARDVPNLIARSPRGRKGNRGQGGGMFGGGGGKKHGKGGKAGKGIKGGKGKGKKGGRSGGPLRGIPKGRKGRGGA